VSDCGQLQRGQTGRSQSGFSGNAVVGIFRVLRNQSEAFRAFCYACLNFTWTQKLRKKYLRNQSFVTFSISIRMF